MRAAVLLVVTCFASTASALDAVVADNPHEKQPSTTCCPAQALAPDSFLPEALVSRAVPTRPTVVSPMHLNDSGVVSVAQALSRQEDTFLRSEQKTHLGAPVTVLHFKQPGRLSSLELPFSLVLLSDINPSGIVEVPAPRDQARDSWFPDYAWEHFVVCAQQEGAYRHLGWRFTRKPTATGAGPSSFVAMIVRVRASHSAVAISSTRCPLFVSPLATSRPSPFRSDARRAAQDRRRGRVCRPRGGARARGGGWRRGDVCRHSGPFRRRGGAGDIGGRRRCAHVACRAHRGLHDACSKEPLAAREPLARGAPECVCVWQLGGHTCAEMGDCLGDGAGKSR